MPPDPRPLGLALRQLPRHLAERASIVSHGSESSGAGEFVLYWAHHALRAEENPALEVAAELALRRRLPLLVFSGLLLPEHRDSDRHASFLLEGLRDFALQLARLGVPFACAARSGSGAMSVLDRLATRAAIVVTEDMPARPYPDWTASVSRRTGRPVVAVDTACIVPMNCVDGVYDRAFAFRDATERARFERLAQSWPRSEWWGRAWPVVEHGEPELDWARLDVAALVANLDLDHSVASVADTVGGTEAGMRRWRAFLAERIDAYARDRDDATLPAVSRMSAYLHYGMVSPLRLARDAAQRGGDGAAKWLDELLVWRELAYHWCRHVPDHASISALPAWARRTLERHRGDERATLSPERLARGETGDELWDLAQRSLVVHGELHNNLRMTWGKAVPAWCATPEAALATLVELNNRFALDGGDPASYGGLLWCLGLFDRAFTPEIPVLGSIRPRTTSGHAARLDIDAYRAIVDRRERPIRVAVIGAGISGLACARMLADHHVEVVVLEKSRGVGGRTATRRGDAGAFDHGAQYFTVRDARFARLVASWERDGVVAPWQARYARVGAGGILAAEPARRLVGVPSMNAVCAHLARGLEVRANLRVSSIAAEGARWRVGAASSDGAPVDCGLFDCVLSSMPAPQAAQLLGPVAPDLARVASRSGMRATWSLMLGLAGRTELPFDHAEVLNGAAEVGDTLAWIARISSKPGRADDGIDRWTVFARPEWSEDRLERAPAEIVPQLCAAFSRLVAIRGVAMPAVASATAHRWRFALAAQEGGPGSLFDASLRIGACGDWLRGTRIEDAYLSGISLAARVLGSGVRGERAAQPAAADRA